MPSRAPLAPAAWPLAGLAASALALALAPAALPETYSAVSETTSEAAAQGVQGAWLARLGFVLFGVSVLATVRLRHRAWNGWATAFHCAFGALMVAAAVFSTRSWEPAARFDRTEDALHSVAATGVGLAFALGVLAVALRPRAARSRPARAADGVAIAASVVLPAAMSAWGGADGALQRAMFLVAYAWYAAEAVRASGGGSMIRRDEAPGERRGTPP